VITIGIDPHKRSLTAAALDPHSRLLGQLRVSASSQAATQLLAWAATWPQRRWAVEGASGLGRGIAQLLVAAGEPVVDVPAKLAARARLLSTSSARRATWPTPARSPGPLCTIGGCAQSPSRATPSSSGCSATVATTWSPNAPGP
jgi:Transposase